MSRMFKVRQGLIFAAAVTLLVSCGNEVPVTSECGALKEFSVDKEYCKRYGLREETFSLKYPSDVDIETQEDYQSINYAGFFKYHEDSTLIESMNIGFYYGLSESGGNNAFGRLLGTTNKSVLGNMINQFRAQGIDMQNVTMQDETIRGEDHFAARGSFETTEDISGYKGKYLIQLVMMATASDHGILLIMAARDDSGVTSFQDFETKGCLAPILQSIE